MIVETFSSLEGIDSYYDVMRMIEAGQIDTVISKAKENRWVRNYAAEILSFKGNEDLVKLLLSMGASELDVLRGASKAGNLNIIKMADVKNTDQKTQKALDRALCSVSGLGELKSVKFLLDRGANVHTDNERPLRLSLISPVLSHKDLETAKLLIQYGADFNYGSAGDKLRLIFGVDKLPRSAKKIINMITIYEIHLE